MAINLHLAKTFAGTYQGLIASLKNNMGDNFSRHIVIVPEKFTLSSEKLIYNGLNTNGTPNLEITSFSRLATKNLKNEDIKNLSSVGSLMLFTKAVQNVKDKLNRYKNCATLNGFYQEMYAVISAIRNSGISIESLTNLDKEKLPQTTKDKLNDIIVIYNSYNKLLANNFQDVTSIFESFSDLINDEKLFIDCHIYILNHYFFSQVQYNIIEELAKNCLSLDICLPINFKSKNSRIYPFATYQHLIGIAEATQNKLNKNFYDSNLKKEFDCISDNLFSYEENVPIETSRIKLFNAETAEKEIEYVARNITKLVIENKYRFNDIAIVVGNIEKYTTPLKKVFERFNIPYYINKKEKLILQAGVRFVVNCLEAFNESYERKLYLKIASNPYSEITNIEFDDFENYLLKHPRNYGLNKPFDKTYDKYFVNAELVRKKITNLVNNFTEQNTIKEYVEMVNQFLENIKFVDLTNDYIENHLKFNNEFYALVSMQVPNKLKVILQEMDEIIGDNECTFEEFILYFKNMITDVEISLVPTYVDSVFIGEAEESMYSQVKAMFVVGANQTVIPKGVTTTSILTLNDMEGLAKNDLCVEPSPKNTNMSNYFYLTQLLAMPNELLFVGYNSSEQTGKSLIIDELSQMFTCKNKPLKIENSNSDFSELYLKGGEELVLKNYPYFIPNEKCATYSLIENVCNENKDERFLEPYFSAYELISDKNKDKVNLYLTEKSKIAFINSGRKLFFGRDYTKISQLEKYFTCPYMHFMEYGLNLKNRDELGLENTDVGNIIHKVLESYFKNLKNYQITEKEIAIMVSGIVDNIYKNDKYNSMLEDSTQKMILEGIRRECIVTCIELTKRVNQSLFRPNKFEVAFGINDKDFKPIALVVKGDSLKLVGKIDRVDKYNGTDSNLKDYISVIDYKTGKVDNKFSNIYIGKKIQLVMYLYALLNQNKDLKPAGIYYQPLKLVYEKNQINRKYDLVGYSNSKEDVISALDKYLPVNKQSKLLNVKLKKDGNFDSRSENNLLEEKQFGKIIDYVLKLSTIASEEIMEGYILATPIDKVCSYCKYSNICGLKEENIRKFDDKFINKDVLINAIENEVEDGVE